MLWKYAVRKPPGGIRVLVCSAADSDTKGLKMF